VNDETKEIAPGIGVKRGQFGQPLVKGTSVGVAELLAELARTLDLDKVSHKLGVTRDGVQAAVAYAAEIISDEPPSRVNERFELFPGVITDGRIRFGKPIVEGTRIDVALILSQLALGLKFSELQESYPSLTRKRVRAALGYAQHRIAGERISAI
jgi:uncharacterized protein (DUF433 family)